VPSLRSTALVFLELFSIECCAVLVEPPMTSSLSFQKGKYLSNEEGYSGEEGAILLCFKMPFRRAGIIFYFIGTLDKNKKQGSI